jgi:hypothetical protein
VLEVQYTRDASDGAEITGDAFVVARDEGDVLCFYYWNFPRFAGRRAIHSAVSMQDELKTDIEAVARRGVASLLASGSSCRYTRFSVA